MTLEERTDLLKRRVATAFLAVERMEREGTDAQITAARANYHRWCAALKSQLGCSMARMSRRVNALPR